MKIVIDSNRIIASLLKEGTAREILYYRNLEFIAPEFVKEEIQKHKGDLLKKVNISIENFDILLSLLFERITLIPQSEYADYLNKLKIEISDPKDIPYLACCLATKSEGIWSHDPHFIEQKKVRIFTNKDLLDLYRS